MIELSNVPAHLQVTGGLLLFLVLGFVLLFLLPGVIHWFRLRGILSALLKFKGPTPPAEIKKLFARDKSLAHLWGEYQDTLHVQREQQDGQMKIVAVRATIPAESYFSGQYLVEIQTKTSCNDGVKLGWETVKDVVGGEAFYRRKHPNIEFKKVGVTNQFFNAQAHEQAGLNDVELVDQHWLGAPLDRHPVTMMDLERLLYAEWSEEQPGHLAS